MDFVVAGWRTKARESRFVKNWAITLAILTLLLATFALAEDFKVITGKIYKDATITRVEADGIVVRTKTGISKIYFVELPRGVQERFNYDPAKALAAQREQTPIKVEAKKVDSPKPDESGGWAGALSISAHFLRMLTVGALIITGVVLFIIRSRS